MPGNSEVVMSFTAFYKCHQIPVQSDCTMISAIHSGWDKVVEFSTYFNTFLCTCKNFLGLLACLPDHETVIDYGKCVFLSIYLYGHSWHIFVEDGEEKRLEEELYETEETPTGIHIRCICLNRLKKTKNKSDV